MWGYSIVGSFLYGNMASLSCVCVCVCVHCEWRNLALFCGTKSLTSLFKVTWASVLLVYAMYLYFLGLVLTLAHGQNFLLVIVGRGLNKSSGV